jgi:hypothetical protein
LNLPHPLFQEISLIWGKFQTAFYTDLILHKYTCHVFPLNYVYNAVYCVLLLTFMLKIVNMQICPLLVQMCRKFGETFHKI